MTLSWFHAFILAYGGIGGWLGIALAVYLYRIRTRPAHPATVLGVFTMGFVLLVGTLLVSDALDPYSKNVSLSLVMLTYTLLIISEIALFTAHIYPDLYGEVNAWATDDPRFTHAGVREYPESEPEQETDADVGETDDTEAKPDGGRVKTTFNHDHNTDRNQYKYGGR